MKAILVREFGGPEVLKLEDVVAPTCGLDQVVVGMRSIGINPVESYIRSGTYARLPLLPYTPGTDGGGVIQAVGENVREFRAGDRVYTSGSVSGTYAEYALCNVGDVHHLPGSASFSDGASLGVAGAIAFRALFQKASAIAGETVLIHGATGGVGISAVQLARAAGLRVIGTGGTEDGINLVLDRGAHHAFNHHEDGYLDRIRDLTGGTGVEIVIEMLANVNLQKDLTIVAKFGRVIVVGSRGRVEIDPRNTMSKDVDVRGTSLMNATAEELRSIHAALCASLENKTLRPVIGKEFPLGEASEAHKSLTNSGSYGKIVLYPEKK